MPPTCESRRTDVAIGHVDRLVFESPSCKKIRDSLRRLLQEFFRFFRFLVSSFFRHSLFVIRISTFCLATLGAAAADIIDSDICIYGGTAGGVAAAVQAARMGKSVVIV